jgi:dTDP-glucose 4,6-dehydratase
MHHVSTDEVFGDLVLDGTGKFTRDTPYNPSSPYSASKASSDHLVRAWVRSFGLRATISNCSNNFGPYQHEEKLIPRMIGLIKSGSKPELYGNGANIRDWLHVDDHFQGIHKVLFSESSGEIFNIGGGEELSNLEITRLILHEMSQDESLIELVEDRPGHDFRYSVNCRKIEEELGYKPRIKFITGLRDTIKWYVDNPSWWNPLVSP